ncbi:methyltransferase [Candidatus Woesearchaeota archaeon]|nr:methyltransferase [Candidatus Woesearchaeota archaeon]
MEQITEGKATIAVYKAEVVSKELPVFYNPVMQSNRDISISYIDAAKCKSIYLPMAGSGVRAVRILKELPHIEQILIRDIDENALNLIKKNLRLNGLDKDERVTVAQGDASEPLKERRKVDYIDIDPFGTPVPFIQAAIQSASKGSTIAVTATDTGCLCGTYAAACHRKYWAKPLHVPIMHEVGLRILIRRIQLMGLPYDRALIPQISYYKDHYFRVYLKVKKSKEEAQRLWHQQQFLLYCPACQDFEFTTHLFNHECGCGSRREWAGPMFAGPLSTDLLKHLTCEEPESSAFLSLLKEECKVDAPFFYDISSLASKHRTSQIPLQTIMEKTHGVRTHFCVQGVKTKEKSKKIIGLIR